MAFLRQSKFRHVFGKPLKRDQCYDNIRITRSSWESTYCAVNPKFLAVITEAGGGGAFLVLPLSKVGRVERDHPLVAGHKAAVLDVAWCPHNDNVIASGSEDCCIKVWQIPDGGLTANLTDPVADLFAHQRRVGLVVWHPCAHNVLLSAGSDNKIFIWNVGLGEALTEIDLPDLPLCASWNHNGSKIVATCKDKKIRIYDPRTADLLKEGKSHEGAKPSQCVYVKDGKIVTTGFSRMSERQYALWDENDLSKPKMMEEIDTSNGVLFPFYDADTSMVYLCGKGDSIIRFYEITDVSPFIHYLSLYQANDPQRGICFMPKRGLDVNHCEIARCYKLHNSGLCEVIPFTVPRKSELFQDDLYPDTASDVPAMTADEWVDGHNVEPLLVSLKGGFVSTKKEALKVARRSNVLDKMPNRAAQAASNMSSVNSSEAAAAAVLPPGFDPQGILDDMRKLKLIVKAHERRIKTLEENLSQYELDEDEGQA
ncbi:coronin-1B-like isoform X2 [Gigantopelta aegis]|uniref:coronin-1B-like isoform X2 n=1 Tax=Gigantopelta aegis TaxID=1735272 RepID=UPI001B88BC6F|nr:coronin-1B-like isoform X2 [Gigantopelta aegis]